MAMPAAMLPSIGRANDALVTQIAFGSCVHQDKPQPIWDTVVQQKPDLFIHLGDNIYGDSRDMEVLRGKYNKLLSQPGYQKLRKTSRVLGTWDDHDYGADNSGSEYPMRAESQKVFAEFIGAPADSPIRKRPGIYDAHVFGPEGKRVQVILLDLRYFRTPLKKAPGREKARNPYMVDEDPISTMLGEAQWKWLEEQFRKPAELRIIASSMQFLCQFNAIEAWAVMPREQEKMYQLIRDTKANGVVFISGDVHWAELAKSEQPGLYPIYDMTSSSLTHSLGIALPNKTRVGSPFTKENFGMIRVDWSAPEPSATLQIIDTAGEVKIEQQLVLSELRIP